MPDAPLPEPRIVAREALRIIGLRKRYSAETVAGIPAQWQAFAPHIGTLGGIPPGVAYGVCCNGDEAGAIDYICGVEVAPGADVPPPFEALGVAAQTYAVFAHEGHVSDIRKTWMAILGQWLPAAGLTMVNAPQFERYGTGFDPVAGLGDVEVWVPVG